MHFLVWKSVKLNTGLKAFRHWRCYLYFAEVYEYCTWKAFITGNHGNGGPVDCLCLSSRCILWQRTQHYWDNMTEMTLDEGVRRCHICGIYGRRNEAVTSIWALLIIMILFVLFHSLKMNDEWIVSVPVSTSFVMNWMLNC